MKNYDWVHEELLDSIHDAMDKTALTGTQQLYNLMLILRAHCESDLACMAVLNAFLLQIEVSQETFDEVMSDSDNGPSESRKTH